MTIIWLFGCLCKTNKLEDCHGQQLALALRENKSLTRLHLGVSPLSSYFYLQIRLPLTISCLPLKSNLFAGVFGSEMAETIAVNSTLLSLHLTVFLLWWILFPFFSIILRFSFQNNHMLKDKSVINFAEALLVNTTLVNLQIGVILFRFFIQLYLLLCSFVCAEWQIQAVGSSDPGVIAICDAVLSNSTLTKLQLSVCFFFQSFFFSLHQNWKWNKGNTVKQQGLAKIVEVLTHSDTLKAMYLTVSLFVFHSF